MKTSLITGVTVLACALAPATALAAAPPKFSTETIVPNRSIGGLKLSAPASTAFKIFGHKECTLSNGCSYTSPKQNWTLTVVFATTPHSAKLIIGDITLATVASSASVPALKTASGIGIGSTSAALKKAYPKLRGNPKQDLYTGTKLPVTVYAITNGHVMDISMHSVALG